MRRWMLNLGAALALFWVIYVLLHIRQLTIWRSFRPHKIFGFRYALVTPGVADDLVSRSTSLYRTIPPERKDKDKKYESLKQLPSVSFEPYPPGTKACVPSGLGPIVTPYVLADLKGEVTSRVQRVLGGVWRPPKCRAKNHAAVIIPYRNRSDNLQMITTHLNYFLQQQMQEYGVFVIEQADAKPFNRAKLLNIGFMFVVKRYPQFDCFIFHDADKLPLDSRHIYKCDANRPRHMISRMRKTTSPKFNRGMLYNYFFGGVTAMTRAQFEKVNGMSNGYWGWGREDDDLSARLRLHGLYPNYNNNGFASYLNIAHKSDVVPNKNPWPHQHAVRKSMLTDGLNRLNFTIKSHKRQPFYTLLSAYL